MFRGSQAFTRQRCVEGYAGDSTDGAGESVFQPSVATQVKAASSSPALGSQSDMDGAVYSSLFLSENANWFGKWRKLSCGCLRQMVVEGGWRMVLTALGYRALLASSRKPQAVGRKAPLGDARILLCMITPNSASWLHTWRKMDKAALSKVKSVVRGGRAPGLCTCTGGSQQLVWNRVQLGRVEVFKSINFWTPGTNKTLQN